MPASPRPDVIIAHPQFLLADQKTGLDGPAHPIGAHQPRDGDGCGRVRQAGLERAIRQRAPQRQPDLRSRQSITHRDHALERERCNLRPLPALLNGGPLPGSSRQVCRQRRDRQRRWRAINQPQRARLAPTPRPGPGCGCWTLTPDPRVVSHLHEIPRAHVGNGIQQRRVVAKGFIANDPLEGQTARRQHVLDHLQPELGFGHKGRVGRDAAGQATRGVRLAEPVLGQLQAAVKQGVATGRGLGQEHASLTVGGFARLTAVLPLHADRLGALLGNIAAVEDHHAVFGIANVVGKPRPEPPEDSVVIPGALAQNVLHAAHGVAVGPAQGQRHRLNRRARKLQQQPVQMLTRPRALLLAGKQRTEDGVKLRQFVQDAGQILGRQLQQWCGQDNA